MPGWQMVPRDQQEVGQVRRDGRLAVLADGCDLLVVGGGVVGACRARRSTPWWGRLWPPPGALGARMTSAGFGGCAVAPEESAAERFVDSVLRECSPCCGEVTPAAYPSLPSAGVGCRELP